MLGRVSSELLIEIFKSCSSKWAVHPKNTIIDTTSNTSRMSLDLTEQCYFYYLKYFANRLFWAQLISAAQGGRLNTSCQELRAAAQREKASADS
jgi:hypothetical protein